MTTFSEQKIFSPVTPPEHSAPPLSGYSPGSYPRTMGAVYAPQPVPTKPNTFANLDSVPSDAMEVYLAMLLDAHDRDVARGAVAVAAAEKA